MLGHFSWSHSDKAQDEVYKENVTKRKAVRCLVADFNIDICLNGAYFDARLGFV